MKILRICLILTILFWCNPLQAEPETTPVIDLHPIANQPGLHLEYQAWSIERLYGPLLREDFNIDILETWTGGVTFKYPTNQRVLGIYSGIQT